MYHFDHNGKVLKITQIVQFITKDIERNILRKGDKLLSINDFSKKYELSRDTVEKAYNELKEKGLIEAVAGRGFYVKGKKNVQLKVLLIFNKLSYYKKIVYESMVQALGSKARIDLQVYHYDPGILKEIIDENMGRYHFYVIMPHFFHQVNLKKCLSIINKIPHEELVLLDKKIAEIRQPHISVYQDFEQDIYQVLNQSVTELKKYTSVSVIFPKLSHHPLEVVKGIKKFCSQHSKHFTIVEEISAVKLLKKILYIVLTESDLALLLKKIKATGYVTGKDVGVISFNETPLKELLNITVISTDFEAMGKTAADLMLQRNYANVHNPFFMIQRGSI
ncbi:MAG: GntR family transcriptional regulator [Bacteroidota bacterium]|nr:GntR family transcriptional regulator [Bacteroidota bacterium]